MRIKILHWMEKHDWHVRHPRTHMFWNWVVVPSKLNGGFGLRHWLQWVTRNKLEGEG